jgi:oxygen-dependent protoporphyrinogen oxidase
VLEASGRVGGKVAVSDVAGVPVDEGAESVLARGGAFAELARTVGLGEALVAPATTTAQVSHGGQLHPLPARQVMGVPSALAALARTGLLSPVELARVLADVVLPAAPLREDVAVGRYVRARMGSALVDRLVEPLLGGVYAGHADRLSLQATIPRLYEALHTTGSLLAAAARVAPAPTPPAPGPPTVPRRREPAFLAVSGGVGRLPGALAAAATARGVDVRLQAPVTALHRTGAGWTLVVGGPDGEQTVPADAVVLAVPAGPAAHLLGPTVPAAAGLVAGIDYASMVVVTAAFPAAALPQLPRGSGILVPPSEGRTVKAVTVSSAKWGWYAGAAPGLVLVRLSLGRHGEHGVLDRDDAELTRVGLADLAALTAVRGEPLDVRVTRWVDGLPQYDVGHLHRVARVREQLHAHPGLEVAGAPYDGGGVPAVIASGQRAAGAVLSFLAGENVEYDRPERT